jgi:D-alanyl-D-alanine carboxypeptidase/D-alanyl-D-alanine-endopeptidase (penicillin-binding protein 4)
MWRASTILALAACGAALVVSPAGAAPPDAPATTPVARAGTPAASERALSRSGLRAKLSAAMASARGASGAWVYEVGATGDPVLFSDDAGRRLIPASNQKLFTTAAFLDELRPHGRLETRAYVRGRVRGPRDSVLAGDLVLVGDGDPAFGTARFARRNDQPVTKVAVLATEIARAGIKRIKGKVLADDTIFDRERRSGPWLSPLSGLSFNNGYDGGEYARVPELVAARALRAALRKRGVKIGGGIGRANLPGATLRRDPLASVASPTAAALIEETNTPSNNFFAEMLLKRVGAVGDKRGTRRRGARRVEAFAKQAGAGGIQAVDGSGLSRKNRTSAEQVGKLLVAVARDDRDARAFHASLAVAGRSGTLADRMRGTAAEGKCSAKTGTLDGVSALSGYCRSAGRTIAFSVLNNRVDVDAAHRAQDRIAAAIARYRP